MRLSQRIMGVKYSFPANLRLSAECLDLIRQIFVADPAKRVTLNGLRQHPWFLQNLPDELKVGLSASCGAFFCCVSHLTWKPRQGTIWAFLRVEYANDWVTNRT